MNISQVLKCRSKYSSLINLLRIRHTSTSTDEKIVIPNRIERGPTDILRALESTLGRDPTAAHYKYHDDPYLIPMSNVGKRTFAMAKEGGRKAAQFIMKEHPDLFQHKVADPVIDAFLPPVIYNENSNVSEDILNKVIRNSQVSDAITIYNLMKTRGIEISGETRQNLLELVCFYNSIDGLPEDLIEERWLRQTHKVKEKRKKTWKDGDFAEELFISIENPNGKAYGALIQGMARYFQVDRAWELFQEAQSKNIQLNTNTYNSLIAVSNFLKESFELRWSFAFDLLQQLEKNQLKPNVRTLNALLCALAHSGNSKNVRDTALGTLTEFKAIGIEPSLCSWYYIMIIFYKEKGPVSTILYDIVACLENKEFEIQDVNDTNFFITAMEVCRNYLGDVDLANRINKIVHFGNNFNFIGDSYKESIYFRNYFCLLCANLPFEEFMRETYEYLVPHIYVPEYSVMTDVLKQAEINASFQYLPRLWSDIVVFDHVHRESIVDIVLSIMANNYQASMKEIQEKFAKIALDIYARFENERLKDVPKFSLTGNQFGKIIMVLLRNGDFENACLIMSVIDKHQEEIVGVPKFEALDMFLEACIEQKQPSKAIHCIQYCYDSGFPEVKDLAKKLKAKTTLDESYLSRLNRIVGDISM